jgi:hypothetical protein
MFNFLFGKKQAPVPPPSQPVKKVPTWKDEVDRLSNELETKRLAELKEQEERDRPIRLAMEAEAKRKAEEELQEKIRVLGETFQCHVCGKKATKPGWDWVDSWSNEMWDPVNNGYSVDDWTKPGDLIQCKECHKWTCRDCLKNDICIRDWEDKLGTKL